jgi:hypothetical protein
MALTLPNLDDRSWDELVAEGRSLIPNWAPDWTNHNAADPGITLIELFAYLSEMLMYRLNRISDESLRAFLRLINGPDWKPGRNLQADKEATLQNLARPRRAVSSQDFESLTKAVNERLSSNTQKIARVKCVARSDLSRERNGRDLESPGHVSVIIITDDRAEAEAWLLSTVSETLESARLLTTHVHVVVPRYVKLTVRIRVVINGDATAEEARKQVVERLQGFWDPLKGGIDGKGWPFGRSVYLSEIYQCLGSAPGVNYVARVTDPTTQGQVDELSVSRSEAWRIKRNPLGQLEAIELRPDEFARIDEDDITVTF